MDAISGVGKLMEGFALTLDSVIGQAFEDWGAGSGQASGSKSAALSSKRFTSAGDAPGSPLQRGARSAAVLAAGEPLRPSAAHNAAATAGSLDWQDFEAGGGEGKENTSSSSSRRGGGRQKQSQQPPHVTSTSTSFMSKLDAASEQDVAEWRKRAQQLASELQRVRAQQEEHERLK